jgi:hypothetical protein
MAQLVTSLNIQLLVYTLCTFTLRVEALKSTKLKLLILLSTSVLSSVTSLPLAVITKNAQCLQHLKNVCNESKMSAESANGLFGPQRLKALIHLPSDPKRHIFVKKVS